MTDTKKIISAFFVAIGFANGFTYVSAADSGIMKVNKVMEDMRALQTVKHVCGLETHAFNICAATYACFDATSYLSIPAVSWCSMSSEVDSFCESAQNMKKECHQDCHDEAHALTACMLKEGGCDVDQCSPGFKEGSLVGQLIGYLLCGYFFFTCMAWCVKYESQFWC
jgi:hypothetical protein